MNEKMVSLDEYADMLLDAVLARYRARFRASKPADDDEGAAPELESSNDTPPVEQKMKRIRPTIKGKR